MRSSIHISLICLLLCASGYPAKASVPTINSELEEDWKEIQGVLKDCIGVYKGDRIEITDLPPVLRNPDVSSFPAEKPQRTIQKNEISLLKDVLEECNWNKKEAARRLGISRSTLYNKLKKYRITRPTLH